MSLLCPLGLVDAVAPVEPVGMSRRSVQSLLEPLARAVPETWEPVLVGEWSTEGERYGLGKFVFRSSRTRFKLGIFAGIHGDEPAGVLALCDLVRELEARPGWVSDYELHVYPLLNPTGYEDGTRESRSGRDLNREFWRGSLEPEVALMEGEILREKFDGYVALHSDDTSDGVYGFVRGATLTEHLLRPALAAAERALPVNRGSLIDGFHAVEGLIRSGYPGILGAPPGSKPQPFEIVLESPALAPLGMQRDALVNGVLEILRHYPQMMAFGGEL